MAPDDAAGTVVSAAASAASLIAPDPTLVARAAQQQLQGVLDNAPQGVLVRTADGRMLYVNRALADIHGFASIDEFRQAPSYTHYIHPDDQPLVTARARARVSNEAAPQAYEFRFLRRDGSVGWMEVNATRASWDGQPVSLSWLIDISARKRAEEALRRSERFFAKLFHENPDVVTLSTLDEGCIIDVNESFLRLTGWDRAQVLGRTSIELGIWHDPALRARTIERLHREGKAHELVSFSFTEGTPPRDYSLSGEIVSFEEQELLLMIWHDVTEQRRQEEQQWRSQRLEALGTLAGGIAHDLNNTLVPVVTLSRLTAKRLTPGSREHQNLLTVAQAGERARDLVKQILAFSRQEESPMAQVDLAAVLRGGMDILRASVPTTIGLELEIGASAQILADEGQLHQVVVNLVTNAAQAIGDGTGKIRIALTPAVPLAEAAGEPRVRLSISDSGCGMDEATRSRIFEPFFTTKGVGEGTGLGLAVVHGIITRHGGTIDVESAPGNGTTFTILLPIAS